MQYYLYFIIFLVTTTTSGRTNVDGFSIQLPASRGYNYSRPSLSFFSLSASSSSSNAIRASTSTNHRIDIDESFKGLEKIHTNPDIFILHDFLEKHHCDDLIVKAGEKKMKQSPVAYAGKFDDVKELLGLAAKGPVAWISIISAWLQVKDNNSAASGAADQLQFLFHVLENYILTFFMAAVGIFLFVQSREDGLQDLRTSTSTTLDDLYTESTLQFVKRSADLFNTDPGKQDPARHAMYFEAPTVIRYEGGQSLAPHYDANRSAETEDANRGGQTLATLLLYLNDVEEGGKTRFGLIASPGVDDGRGEDNKLAVRPKAGDALLFFPADRDGRFDERLEHEGCPAVDTKWIARIWRHIDRVPPPFGLSNSELLKL